MNVLILMGSPRLHGNTAELCKYFIEELKEQSTEVKYIELEKNYKSLQGVLCLPERSRRVRLCAEGCLWEGKQVAIIATHGYDGEYATEPFEVGMKRLCIHSNLKYVGMYSVQDNDNLASFQTNEAIEGVKAFARKVISE